MLRKTFVLCCYIAFMTSCGSSNQSGNHDHSHDEAHNHEHTHDHDSEHDHEAEHSPNPNQEDHDGQDAPMSHEITLNDGAKWEANQETTIGIERMLELIQEFPDRDDSQAYESLNSNLKNEFNLIFENCTMKGEAHNQLHNFLMPMNPMMNQLLAADLELQKKTLSDLTAHLKSYNGYFE